jgi:hypothetical protein
VASPLVYTQTLGVGIKGLVFERKLTLGVGRVVSRVFAKFFLGVGKIWAVGSLGV